MENIVWHVRSVVGTWGAVCFHKLYELIGEERARRLDAARREGNPREVAAALAAWQRFSDWRRPGGWVNQWVPPFPSREGAPIPERGSRLSKRLRSASGGSWAGVAPSGRRILKRAASKRERREEHHVIAEMMA